MKFLAQILAFFLAASFVVKGDQFPESGDVFDSSVTGQAALSAALKAEMLYIAQTGPGSDTTDADAANWKAGTTIKDIMKTVTKESMRVMTDALGLK